MVTALDIPKRSGELDLKRSNDALVPRTGEVDKIDSLISQLSEAKNRKEKRRLLAEYN
jgi:hypothetical protein